MKLLWGMSASFCNIRSVFAQLDQCKDEIYIVCSDTLFQDSSKFYDNKAFIQQVSSYSVCDVMHTIHEVEALTGSHFDAMVLAPCTANTLAKLVHGIYDNGLLMACKVALRNQIPIIIGYASNDGLGIGMENIARAMVMKHLYFVPFSQDNYLLKENSLVCDWSLIDKTIACALQHKQLQPVIRGNM